MNQLQNDKRMAWVINWLLGITNHPGYLKTDWTKRCGIKIWDNSILEGRWRLSNTAASIWSQRLSILLELGWQGSKYGGCGIFALFEIYCFFDRLAVAAKRHLIIENIVEFMLKAANTDTKTFCEKKNRKGKNHNPPQLRTDSALGC